MKPNKSLLFIDIVSDTGRASHFSAYGRKKNDSFTLFVGGGLTHGDEFQPRSIKDADNLILWLYEWKELQKNKI